LVLAALRCLHFISRSPASSSCRPLLILYFAPHRSLPPKELEGYLLSKPQFLLAPASFGMPPSFYPLRNARRFARRPPFWSSLGCKKTEIQSPLAKANPWATFSLAWPGYFVFLASSQVHTNDKMPIEEVLKNRSSATS